tara:strand:- start:38241 stop:39005 length:765 start_codon:yes stop_codon:yes gene_type:complete
MKLAICLTASVFTTTAFGAPGRIVVNADEWTLSDSGNWGQSVENFALNIAEFLTNQSTGANVLAYSQNFGLTGNTLANAMTSAGHSWTVDNSSAFELSLLQQYDAVYLGGRINGNDPDAQVLVDYVNSGGNVFLMGGSGTTGGYGGNPVLEAAAWNPFLNEFGLAFSTAYDAGSGTFNPEDTDHPIFQGVDALFQSVGQGIIDLNNNDDTAQTFLNFLTAGDETRGRYAVYEIPAPSGLSLLACAGLLARRRRN